MTMKFKVFLENAKGDKKTLYIKAETLADFESQLQTKLKQDSNLRGFSFVSCWGGGIE